MIGWVWKSRSGHYWAGVWNWGRINDAAFFGTLGDMVRELGRECARVGYPPTADAQPQKVRITEEPSRLEECELGREDGWVVRGSLNSAEQVWTGQRWTFEFSNARNFSTPSEALRYCVSCVNSGAFRYSNIIPVRRVPGGTRIEEINE